MMKKKKSEKVIVCLRDSDILNEKKLLFRNF